MKDNVIEFKSKTELAKSLGVSRNTLASRLRKYDVQVAQVPFKLTLEQLEQLKQDGRTINTKKDYENNNQHTNNIDEKASFPDQDTENIPITDHHALIDSINLRSRLNHTQAKLDESNEKLFKEQRKHISEIIELTNKFSQLADQSQRLQLDLQKRLTDAPATEKIAEFDSIDSPSQISELKQQLELEKSTRIRMETKLSNITHELGEVSNTLSTTNMALEEILKQNIQLKSDLNLEQSKGFWQRLFGR